MFFFLAGRIVTSRLIPSCPLQVRLLSSLPPTSTDSQSKAHASSYEYSDQTSVVSPVITEPPRRNSLSLPAWLRGLLPGGQHLASPGRSIKQPNQNLLSASTSLADSAQNPTLSPATADSEPLIDNSARGANAVAPPTEKAIETEAEKMRKEYSAYLEKHRDISVDAFIEMTKQLRAEAEGAPLPTLPPVRKSHPEFKRFVDWKRVSYLRSVQHERIANMMTEDEKGRVKREGDLILKDRQFISNLADRTGTYIDLEVLDCLRSYFETKDRMRRLYRWVVVLGQPEPLTNEQQFKALKEMEALEGDEERLEKLEKQSTLDCPILPLIKSMGHDAVCSRTGLKFYQCCGGATGGRPAWMDAKDRGKALGGQRGRFSPRAERSARKMIKDRQEEGMWEKI